MRMRKITAFLLAAVVSLCCFASAGNVYVRAASIEDMQSDLDDAKAESNRIKAEIAALEAQNAPYEEKLSALKKQIAATEREIDLYNQQIAATNKKIKQFEADIAKCEAEAADTKRALGKRLAAIYKSNSNTGFMLLFSADSLSDYLNKSELLRAMTERDNQMIDEIMEKIEEINDKKAELDKSVSQLAADKQTYADKQAELDKQYAEVNAIVKKHNSQIGALEESKSDYDQIVADMKAAIKKAQEEANRVQGTGVFTWPVPGYYKLSDSYGWRICPVHGKEFHTGIDISSSGIYGARIVAADAGTVLLSRAYGDYGNCIMIDHGNGYVTLYAHMKSLSQYGVGTKVSKGQTIGYVGSTGASTGPHLHFEVRKNGSTVDPMSFF